MTAPPIAPSPIVIETDDGFPLAAMSYGDRDATPVVIAAAMAVPQRFYRHLAAHLATDGHRSITFDYRGVAASATAPTEATISDWALTDLPAVVSHAAGSGRTHLIGHSLGGQIAGLVPRPELIASMVTIVAQSGHWRFQGGNQRALVAFGSYVTLPVLGSLFRRMPFEAVGFGEDVPAPAARQWARWSRDRNYLFGDTSLPLYRYDRFTAPTLAFSVDDDDWGTARSVDAVMQNYPNVERRHLVPSELEMDQIGHMGAFLPGALPIWDQILEWFDRA